MKHFLITLLLGALTLFGYSAPTTMLGNTNYVQTQYFTLAGSGATLGATTLVLSSFKDFNSQANLTMADFGSKGFGTIEPNNGTKEESITFTGVTQNSNGTATLTGVSACSNKYPYTETSGLTITHPGGVKFVISNTACFYNTFAGQSNTSTITGNWVFNVFPVASSSLTNNSASTTQFATIAYVNSTTISGAPNIAINVKGIGQEATDAQLQAGTLVGTTGADLLAAGGSFNQTSTANKVPVSNGSGKLDNNWLNGDVANGIATLNTSTLVVQNPANATSTPTANKISIADANGNLDAWVAATTSLNFVPTTNASGLTTTYWTTVMPIYPRDSASVGDGVNLMGFTTINNNAGTKIRYADYTDVVLTNADNSLGAFIQGASSSQANFASTTELRLRFRALWPASAGAGAQKGIGLGLSPFSVYQPATSTTSSVRFVIDNSTVYAFTGNGSSASSTALTIANPLKWNTYEIIFTTTSVKYYVNGILGATHTNTIPNSTVAFNFLIGSEPNGNTISMSDVVITQKVNQ